MVYTTIIICVIAISALGAVLYRSGVNKAQRDNMDNEVKKEQKEKEQYAKIKNNIDGLSESDIWERLRKLQDK